MPLDLLPPSRLPGPLISAVNKFLQIDKLEQLCNTACSRGGFVPELLQELGIEVRVSPEDLRKIPARGPVVALANHPTGFLDGAVLLNMLDGIRPDVRLLTNSVLGQCSYLADRCIFIDPFARPENRGANGRALREALRHLRNGGLLLVFPAGEVSHFDFRAAGIRDPEWQTTAARLIGLTKARTVPILVGGANSIPFQMLGMVHPRLRTAALPAELLNKRGRIVNVSIGGFIEPARLEAFPDHEAATRYLRLRTDLLGRRGDRENTRVETRAALCLAAPAALLAREIDELPPSCLLDETRDMAVFIADACSIPLALQEIGRLRELTFRAAGEGTGQACDLDKFDPHYLHLFVWNKERREIVGAYRMGDVPHLLKTFGRKGLYTETLFRFGTGFLEGLGPALELGRSFIRPEYQRQFSPLLLLWKGICAWVARRPEYSTLIGAVSIGNQYSNASRELISQYFAGGADGAVKPRRPLRTNLLQKWETQSLCSLIPDAEDLSGPIADLEPDGKGLPILVKQYARLGGRLLAFSLDPQFGNTLDGFVVLDLRETQPELLARYMGKDRTRDFFAWHASVNRRAA